LWKTQTRRRHRKIEKIHKQGKLTRETVDLLFDKSAPAEIGLLVAYDEYKDKHRPPPL